MKEEKFMSWRLKELPTAEGVASLVKQKVINAQEARDMLFRIGEMEKRVDFDKEKESSVIKEIKDEIKLLRELVLRLSQQQPAQIIEIIRERPQLSPWIQPYTIWCNSHGTTFSDNFNKITN